jgi:hypothetical protein
LHQCTITTLSRTVTRFNQRTRETFIVNDANRFQPIRSGDHVVLRGPSSDQPLNQ